MACDVVLAGRRGIEIFGLPLASWSGADFSHIVRLSDGVFGQGPLSWAAPLAALGALALARNERRTMAGQWVILLGLTVLQIGRAHV